MQSVKEADGGGGEGTHGLRSPGREDAPARSPRTRLLTTEEPGCWLSPQTGHHVLALSQAEVWDEIRCHQLTEATSC